VLGNRGESLQTSHISTLSYVSILTSSACSLLIRVSFFFSVSARDRWQRSRMRPSHSASQHARSKMSSTTEVTGIGHTGTQTRSSIASSSCSVKLSNVQNCSGFHADRVLDGNCEHRSSILGGVSIHALITLPVIFSVLSHLFTMTTHHWVDHEQFSHDNSIVMVHHQALHTSF
jgi:hypothetical protein